jgi:hypothetical protein
MLSRVVAAVKAGLRPRITSGIATSPSPRLCRPATFYLRVCANTGESARIAFFTRGESRGYSRAVGPATISSQALSSLRSSAGSPRAGSVFSPPTVMPTPLACENGRYPDVPAAA